MRVETVRTEGLGDSTHVLIHEGLAVVVDPQRDIDRFERVLDHEDADLRMVIETHLHNDYISGGLAMSRQTGAELLMPAGAAPVFRHRPAFHQEDIDLGSLTIRPIHTPGHTPEHTSYLVVFEGREQALFSGGCLLVGTAGRTDLLGEERAESLARLQYGSVVRLADLPDHVDLFPTHGAGSFCTSSGAGDVTSTIGAEKKTNPVLLYEDEDAFVKGQLANLVPYPAYYRHMGPMNLRGVDEADLSVPEVETIPQGVTVVDARPMQRYATGHLPGALGIELRDSFGTWVGWLTEHNTPLVLVMDTDQDTEEAMRQLARIGYDDVRGVVRHPAGDGVAFEVADVRQFADAARSGAQILDVRAPNEWVEEGSIEGSTLSYVPDVARETPAGLTGSGFSAVPATGQPWGILQDRGFDPVVLIEGGATDVLAHTSKAT